jgi:hypothetical protein
MIPEQSSFTGAWAWAKKKEKTAMGRIKSAFMKQTWLWIKGNISFLVSSLQVSSGQLRATTT